jgi:hypothetical protein
MKFWSQADKPLKYGHCVRLSISNAVQREISEESAAEALKILNKRKKKGEKKIVHGDKKNGDLTNMALVTLCQLENIELKSKAKRSKRWRKETFKKVSETRAPFVIIGDVVDSDGNLLEWRHAVATRDGFMLDPDKREPIVLTKELLEKTFHRIVKAYLLIDQKPIPSSDCLDSTTDR